jgi:hypothetical protein
MRPIGLISNRTQIEHATSVDPPEIARSAKIIGREALGATDLWWSMILTVNQFFFSYPNEIASGNLACCSLSLLSWCHRHDVDTFDSQHS